jgi:hypothetical protein
MHTWQMPKGTHIDYLFRSSLEGKVDVGWNYSRISYIRNMWSNHSRTLASRLGKPLPESNIKISTSQTLQDDPSEPDPEPGTADTTAMPSNRPRAPSTSSDGQEKITAVVNVPQSRYEYTPLEPPLIQDSDKNPARFRLVTGYFIPAKIWGIPHSFVDCLKSSRACAPRTLTPANAMHDIRKSDK